MKRKAKGPAGFTLIELLVVMGITALILGAVLVAKPKAAALRVAATAESVIRDLHLARAQAMSANAEAVFRVDLESRQFGLPNAMQKLPQGMTVAITVAESERHAGSGDIRFYQDGQSSGGQVVLMLDQHQMRIDVNWLTGEPQVHR